MNYQNLMDQFPKVESHSEIQSLLKAMEANEGVTDVSQLRGASALQPQSLENSVVSLLFDESYFKAIKNIPEANEKSTLIEYTERSSYGSYNRGGFVSQSENPRQADPSFRRQTEQIKFIRELWSISSVLSASQTITDTETEAVDAALMRAMETAERSFFFGNSDIIPEEWNGLDRSIENQSGNEGLIIDMRGEKLGEAILKDSCRVIADHLGLANDMYVSYNVQQQVDTILNPTANQRYSQNSGDLTFDLGHIINGFRASFAKNGRVRFINDYFLKPEEEGVPMVINSIGNMVEGATSDMAPQMPNVSGSAVAPTVTGSKWMASGNAPAGTYEYRVSSENRYGMSKAAAPVSVTVAANGAARLTIVDNSVTNHASGYKIYREVESGSGKFRLVKRIPADLTSPTKETVWDDLNHDIAGTSVAYLGDFNSRGVDGPMRTVRMKKLVGWHKTRYSVIGPYFWGAVNYYAAPVFYAPKRFVKIKNIGIE